MDKILITGACGQLGSELTARLRALFGNENVVASDITEPIAKASEGPFEKIDVMDRTRLEDVIQHYHINTIYHLAALLSAKAERNRNLAWKLNIDGLLNVLDLAAEKEIRKVFWPSSIAVFGPDARKESTPQNSACNPETVYGISKLAGEQWCAYYHKKHGVDVRSLRYPGLIGYKSMPGGGTTDYAVDIFHKAAAGEVFRCFLEADTTLPMMYMEDAVKATTDLMEADGRDLSVRTSYNIAAISFSPDEIAEAIRKHLPGFEIEYEPDYRQQIAESWPDTIDDSQARTDWNWRHRYSLEAMVEEILEYLPAYLNRK